MKIAATAATAPGQFEYFFPSSAAGEGDSFWEKNFKRVTFDKVELATKTAPHMTKADLEKRFDWKQNIEAIVALINGWNA